MSDRYIIRPATLGDLPFLCEAILGAELSGGGRAGIAALFDLSTDEARPLVAGMLNEEIDGCELSVSSFLVACAGEHPVAAVAGWVEGRPDGTPSGLLKANLIGFTFPPAGVKAAASRRDIVKGIQIEREPDSLQIEYVFTDPAHRGHGLAARLIRDHMARTQRNAPEVRLAQVQLFTDNTPAVALYERLGFRPVRTYRSDHPDTLRYLPSNEKLLMATTLNQNDHG